MVKERKPPRGTGEWGNGGATGDLAPLRAAGLHLVRFLDDRGKVSGEVVVPDDEIPAVCVAQQQCPTGSCRACHAAAWRLDRGTRASWVCGRCHP